MYYMNVFKIKNVYFPNSGNSRYLCTYIIIGKLTNVLKKEIIEKLKCFSSNHIIVVIFLYVLSQYYV